MEWANESGDVSALFGDQQRVQNLQNPFPRSLVMTED